MKKKQRTSTQRFERLLQLQHVLSMVGVLAFELPAALDSELSTDEKKLLKGAAKALKGLHDKFCSGFDSEQKSLYKSAGAEREC